MITGDQILLHLIGDYCNQSDWMAQQKVKHWWPALCHATVYSLPFMFMRPSISALLVIWGTHYLIDRYRLARYVVWVKNFMGASRTWWKADYGNQIKWFIDESPNDASFVTCEHWHAATPPFKECSATGYPPTAPAWLAVWLMIACDNCMHILINGLALKWL